ncbi:hypothetical protein [Hydrogenophaga soli]
MQPQNTQAPPPSERAHPPFWEEDTPGDEVLVYRPLQSHMVPIISPRTQRLLWGVLTVGVLAYVAWTLLRTFPELGRLDGEGWRTLAAAVWQKDSEKFRGWLLPMLYPLAVVVSAGVQWLSIHRLTLRIGPQGLWQEHRLPLGLHHLFGQNWQIAWGDVRRITVRRSNLVGGAVPALAWVEIVVAVGYGRQRVLRPAFWFRLNDPPRPRLKPSGSPSPLTAPWGGFINETRLAEAFAQLRLVRALEKHAPPACRAWRWPGTAPVVGTDLNRQPEALALLLGTIVVFLTGWVLMLCAPHVHLHASPTWMDRAAWSLGTLALWALAAWGWRGQPSTDPLPATPTEPPKARDPVSKPALAFAALLWVAAVAFVTEPLLVHAALLGRGDAWQTHRFAIADGQAKPMGADAAHVPPIELPGRQSRLAWIRAGSEADVRTVEGRWGVWIYNDEPLRALADQQGVR